MNEQNIKSILTYLNPNLLENISTTHYHVTHKYHERAIMERKRFRSSFARLFAWTKM